MLNKNHWMREDFKERLTRPQIKKILLDSGPTIIYKGRIRELTWSHIGMGAYYLFKKPLKENMEDA